MAEAARQSHEAELVWFDNSTEVRETVLSRCFEGLADVFASPAEGGALSWLGCDWCEASTKSPMSVFAQVLLCI